MACILGLPKECGEEVLAQPVQVRVQAGTFCAGRARLLCMADNLGPSSHEMLIESSGKSSKIALTAHSTQMMQCIAVAVQMSEPLLLVGESGTGKTTIIQHIAQQVHPLHGCVVAVAQD
jgi:midasin